MKHAARLLASGNFLVRKGDILDYPGNANAQVASWGGYSFIINLLPIHCLASIFTGRLTAKLYIAYAPLIVLGTLEAGEALSAGAVHNPACSSYIWNL